ncbi:MAG: type II secretion system protein, partial [Patescibacteria group bacterium]
MRKKNKQGFSLIEIIAVVAIGLILISVVLFSFSSFRNSKIIEVSADQVLSVINEARVKAVSSEDYSRFGVHLEIGRIVFFKGDIFTEPNLSNIETAFSPL